jgi:small subunit ribosomal protein S16
MATTLRLQVHGTHKRPYYHVVAADSRKKLGGQILEKLGVYDPRLEPSKIELKADRIQEWFGKGATVSNTVAVLIKRAGIKLERTKKITRQPKAASAKKKAK